MPIALGRSTFAMNRPPSILSSAAVGGKKEGEGPIGLMKSKMTPPSGKKPGKRRKAGFNSGPANWL